MPKAQTSSFSSLLAASQTAAARGAFSEAAGHAIAARAIAGSNPYPLLQSAHVLVRSGESRLAHETIESLSREASLETLQGDREVLELLATALHAMKRYQPALGFARKASAAGSTDPAWTLFLATLEMFCGNTDRAKLLLERILRERPDMAAAHWTLAKLTRQTPDENHVDRLRRQIHARDQHDAALPYLFFALFKELDDIGETGEAWQALVNGSVAWRRSVNYDLQRDLDGYAQLARAFPRNWSAPLAATVPDRSTRPIFIVGLPRSGTTLVERMLGGHSSVHACGELDDMPAAMMRSAGLAFPEIPDATVSRRIAQSDHSSIALGYLQNTGWRAEGRSLFTDKRPNNFLYIPSIAASIPGARIVHIQKQPVDSCFSLLKEFFGGKYNYSYRLSELAKYYDGYRRLMQHWRDSGHEFLDVSYESLANDPEGEGRRILAHCGLEWQPECLQTERRDGAIGTASVTQAREPVSSRYIAAWKRYETQLAPLQDMLNEH